ncbi:MAG: MFS transporter [Pseudomonadota bacterium]|nr:MFS transporter [Pseudomonadota bacterium]
MTDSIAAAENANNPYASTKAAYYALGILTIVYSINFIDRQLLSILQESIKADLVLSDAQLGLLTGFAFAVFYTFAGLPIASLADRSNRRNIVAISLTIWSGMTAISGLAQNYWQLLAARVGVGIGEAGGSPPSHSMISDIFPPEKRASAIGFYSTGISIGILFGFLFGGWLNEFFGWRVAFFVVGIPGVLLALVLYLTVSEPIRGLAENKASSGDNPSMVTVFKVLLSRRSFLFMALGAAMNAFAGYSTANWVASFMIRTHQMPTGELGTWLALIIGLGGAIGVFGSGVLADNLGKKDKRWYMWVPVYAAAISVPFQIATYWVDGPYAALICLTIPSILANAYLGATIASVHGMVGLRMRAVSSALLFFILNIIGLGMGPTTVGLVSDSLVDQHDVDSLRYAMMYIIPTSMFISGALYMLASRYIREDLANAPD